MSSVETYGKGTVHHFDFDNLNHIQKHIINGALARDKERMDKEHMIRNQIDRRDTVHEVLVLNDEYQFARISFMSSDKEHTYWKIFLNYKSASRMTETLDGAIIMALSIKHSEVNAAHYIAKMLGVETEG